MTLQYKYPWFYKLLIPISMRKHVRMAFGRAVGENVSVLDVAAGFGHSRRAMHSSVKYRGVDLNERFIEHARKNNLDVRKGDIFDSSSYMMSDVVTLVDVVHHIPAGRHAELLNLAFAYAEKRVIVLEPGFLNVSKKSSLFGPFVDWLFKKLDSDGVNEIEQWYTADDYKELFVQRFNAENGKDFKLEVVDVYPYIMAVYYRDKK